MKVRTDVLYLDIRMAIERAGLATSASTFGRLKRKRYPFGASDLVTRYRRPATS